MKNIITVFCILLTILVFNSCNSSSSIVTFDDNSEPGRRDYVWTIIDSTGSNLSLTKIWGDSPSNIWIAGGFALKDEERLWHYNGSKLEPVCASYIYPECIFGFGENDMFTGSNSIIWRNKGTGWEKELTPYLAGFGDNCIMWINDINGNDVNNLWTVGTVWDYTNRYEYGLLYRHTEKGWERNYVTKDRNASFNKVFPGYTDNQCFILGLKHKYSPNVDSSTVWEYDGKKLKQIYVGVMEDLDNGCALNKINGIIYITIGHKIYRYYEGKLYDYLNVTHPDFVMAVYGRNEKDLFLWAREGLLHYNGTDVQYVYKPGWPIYIHERVLLFDKEVYICAQNTTTGKYNFIKGVLPDKK